MNNNYDDFKISLLKVLSDVAPDRSQTDYDEAKIPGTNSVMISFTWFLSEEDKVDSFIKAVRDRLLKYPRLTENEIDNGFIFEIWKSHIQSHDYWSLAFWLADKYQLTEDSQP